MYVARRVYMWNLESVNVARGVARRVYMWNLGSVNVARGVARRVYMWNLESASSSASHRLLPQEILNDYACV